MDTEDAAVEGRASRDIPEQDIERIVLWLCSKAIRRNPSLDFDDLHQEGWVAAIEAVKDYDPNNPSGAKLTTFIIRYVTNAIKAHIYSVNRNVIRMKTGVEMNERRDRREGSSTSPAMELCCRILCPFALRIVQIQLGSFPSRLSRKRIGEVLGLAAKDVDDLYYEIRCCGNFLREQIV